MTIRLYIFHFIVMIGSLFLFIPLNFLWDNTPWFSVITAILYTVVIYSTSWNYGLKDSKNIDKYTPNIKKSILTSVLFAVLPICLLVFYIIMPDIFSIDFIKNLGNSDIYNMVQGTIMDRFVDVNNFLFEGNIISSGMDLVYKVYYFALESFLGNDNILIYLFPVVYSSILVIVGYFLGTKKKRFIIPVIYNFTNQIKYKKDLDK